MLSAEPLGQGEARVPRAQGEEGSHHHPEEGAGLDGQVGG